MNTLATKLTTLRPDRRDTYATVENAHRAVAKAGFDDLRYYVCVADDGRYFPVFSATEETIARQVFRKFVTFNS